MWYTGRWLLQVVLYMHAHAHPLAIVRLCKLTFIYVRAVRARVLRHWQKPTRLQFDSVDVKLLTRIDMELKQLFPFTQRRSLDHLLSFFQFEVRIPLLDPLSPLS